MRLFFHGYVMMKPSILHVFACVLLLLEHNSRLVLCVSEHPILVIIGFDGFRPDYLKRGLTPTLAKFVQDGVSTDYLWNIFPTKTMPNFFSIATGLYAETHGVLGNTVFNEKRECIKYGYEFYHSANVTPIWVRFKISYTNLQIGSLIYCCYVRRHWTN